jgi:hypothetical protein
MGYLTKSKESVLFSHFQNRGMHGSSGRRCKGAAKLKECRKYSNIVDRKKQTHLTQTDLERPGPKILNPTDSEESI